MPHIAKCLLIAHIILGTLAGPAQAAPLAPANSITVNSLLDTAALGKCRLRDAIIAANTNSPVNGCPAGAPGMDTIGFSLFFCPISGCVVQLASTLPLVTQDLTISGRDIHISGENQFPVFTLSSVVVNLSNLRVVKGKGTLGAGIIMDGTTLTLNNVRVSENVADSGSGIYLPTGTLYAFNSSFVGNLADDSGFGGAIGQMGGAVVISGTTFSGNHAGAGGAIGTLGISTVDVTESVFDNNLGDFTAGAIFLQDDSVHAIIAGSTFTNNQALSAENGGGAIWLQLAALTLVSSTLANNISNGRAGALEVFGGQLTVTNVTLSSNTAKDSGGALFVESFGPSHTATVTLNNVTISGNTADSDNNNTGDGGGIHVITSTANIRNSIIAGNFDSPGNSGAGTIQPDCTGTFISPTNSLVGRNEGCAGFVDGSNGNRVGTSGSPLDPQLAPLADNGGPTLTQALLGDSPAIDGGNPSTPGSGGFACAATDQRGLQRSFGSRCDMGAYERAFWLYLPFVLR